MTKVPTYEPCARCGFDHEYEPNYAQLIHGSCPACQKEVKEGRIGEGPDHVCADEIHKVLNTGSLPPPR